jgi:hypothetical protein
MTFVTPSVYLTVHADTGVWLDWCRSENAQIALAIPSGSSDERGLLVGAKYVAGFVIVCSIPTVQRCSPTRSRRDWSQRARML